MTTEDSFPAPTEEGGNVGAPFFREEESSRLLLFRLSLEELSRSLVNDDDASDKATVDKECEEAVFGAEEECGCCCCFLPGVAILGDEAGEPSPDFLSFLLLWSFADDDDGDETDGDEDEATVCNRPFFRTVCSFDFSGGRVSSGGTEFPSATPSTSSSSSPPFLRLFFRIGVETLPLPESEAIAVGVLATTSSRAPGFNFLEETSSTLAGFGAPEPKV